MLVVLLAARNLILPSVNDGHTGNIHADPHHLDDIFEKILVPAW